MGVEPTFPWVKTKSPSQLADGCIAIIKANLARFYPEEEVILAVHQIGLYNSVGLRPTPLRLATRIRLEPGYQVGDTFCFIIL